MINKHIYAVSLRKRTYRAVIANLFAHYYYNQLDINEDLDLSPIEREMLKKDIELDGLAYCYSIHQLW